MATLDPVPFVVSLAKRHYEAIGFLPAPRLQKYADAGQLWVESENGEPCGFLVWGNGWPVLKVYQVCIQYDAQRLKHATILVSRLIHKGEAEGYDAISCWVADDIPANDFWASVGFRKAGSRAGGAYRGRIHNRWIYRCSSPIQIALLA